MPPPPSATQAPKKKFATLGDLSGGRGPSHAGHGHGDDDDDEEDDDDDFDPADDDNPDLYAGGEKSGLAVENPSTADKLRKKIIKKAQKCVAPSTTNRSLLHTNDALLGMHLDLAEMTHAAQALASLARHTPLAATMPLAGQSKTPTHLDRDAHLQLNAVSTSGQMGSRSMTVHFTAQTIQRTLPYLLRSKQAAPHLRYSTLRRVKRWMCSWSNTRKSTYSQRRNTSLLVAGARDWVVLRLMFQVGQRSLPLRQHQLHLQQQQELRHKQQQLT